MKKLLALVLALVMSMSLVTISNAAYDDAADIDYSEAVDVLTAVGVLEGSDGKFDPKAELTREQAAKIIAYLDLGKKVADALPSVQVFSDVAADRWSAKYIAYCADAGYLAGVGDNKFDPTGKLTGYAFGKMLLCVLGYDATVEEFTGASWQIKVSKLMEKNGLSDGVDKLGSAVLTREEAAQYALNALEATTVEYENKGTDIDLGTVGSITVGASSAKDVVVSASTKYQAIDATKADGKDIVQLGEKLYKGDLKKSTADPDAFGRPATAWTYDGEDVGTYADKPDYTFTGVTSESTVYSKLGGKNGTLTITDIYEDGVERIPTYGTSETYSKSTTDNAPYFGNGVTVEAYEIDDGNGNSHYRLVAVRDYLGKVDQVNKADPDTDTDRSVVIKLETVPSVFQSKVTCENYETEEFAKKDMVIVNVAITSDSKIVVKSAKLAEKVSDQAVTAYKQGNMDGATVTFGGTKYSYSQNFKGTAATPTVANQTYNMKSGNTYDFYLDSYGNVIETKVHSETNTDYYFVIDVVKDKSSDFTTDKYNKYKVVDMTGSVSIVSVMTKNADSADKGWIVTMEEDSDNDGYMKLTAMSTAYTAGSDTAGYKNSSTTTFSNKSAMIGSDIAVDNSTVFVLQTGSSSYKAVTGVKNMDSYSSLQTLTGSSVPVASIMKDDVAVVVYMNVYNAKSTSSTDSLVYLLSEKPSVTYDADNEYEVYTYAAIVDGEVGEVAIKKGTNVKTDMGIDGKGLYVVDSTVDGYVQKLKAVSGTEDIYDKVDLSRGYNATFKSGVLTLGSSNAYVVDDDAVVYAIDNDGKVTVTDAEALDGTLTGTAYVVMESDKDATVNAVYFAGTIK